MSVILAFFATSLGKSILGGAGVVLALVFGWFKARAAGAKAERDKQIAARMAARSEADKIDQAVAGMTDEEVIKEQAKWSRG